MLSPPLVISRAIREQLPTPDLFVPPPTRGIRTWPLGHMTLLRKLASDWRKAEPNSRDVLYVGLGAFSTLYVSTSAYLRSDRTGPYVSPPLRTLGVLRLAAGIASE